MELTVISILSAILTLGYVLVVLSFLRGWLNIPYFKRVAFTPLTRVSVLIAARNEAEGIQHTIEDILNQDYPRELIEVIIVDDHSTDNTAEIIQLYAGKGVTLLKLNESEPLNSYKKKAITEAIHISTGELMLTTDADCRMDKKWLSTIVNYYQTHQPKLISSPVAYFNEQNLFEQLQTLEFAYLIGLGASTIGNKMPSTCNGANLAYRRDMFFELNGFRGIDDLASGDDELFLHKVASRYPDGVGFCKSADAIVYTYAKPNLREFIRQRRRWASKSTRYKNKGVVVLGVLIWLFNVLILLNGILGLFNAGYWCIAIGTLAAKFLVELLFLVPVMSFMKRLSLLWYLPLLTVIHILYFIYIGMAGNSGKYYWKGRMVR